MLAENYYRQQYIIFEAGLHFIFTLGSNIRELYIYFW